MTESRRRALLAAVGCAIAASASGPTHAEPQPVAGRVVVILADDVGPGDLGCYGAAPSDTPHLDRLAAGGVRFTSAYSCSPVCAPARAGLFTGRYPERSGYVMTTGSYRRQLELERGLPVDEPLLVAPFRDAGFRVGLVGKWHLGVRPRFHPMERGFDEFFGFLGGVHDYFDWDVAAEGPILRGREPADGEGYLTTAFTTEALSFIDRHRDRPFLLVVAHSAVHLPEQVPAAYLGRVRGEDDRARRAMLLALDDGVGELVARLRSHELLDDTLIVFASDNGADRASIDLRGTKGRLYEGGLRVPLLLHWPAGIDAGRTREGLVSLMDVLPTALSACGVDRGDRPLDGRDLLPLARGDQDSEDLRDELCWSFGAWRAIRRGDHKLLRAGPLTELYDLASDPEEEQNLAPSEREICAALGDRLARWFEPMPPPLWWRK